jgi:hypothetical protein
VIFPNDHLLSKEIFLFSSVSKCRKEIQNKMVEKIGIYTCFAVTIANFISNYIPQNAKQLYGTLPPDLTGFQTGKMTVTLSYKFILSANKYD